MLSPGMVNLGVAYYKGAGGLPADTEGTLPSYVVPGSGCVLSLLVRTYVDATPPCSLPAAHWLMVFAPLSAAIQWFTRAGTKDAWAHISSICDSQVRATTTKQMKGSTNDALTAGNAVPIVPISMMLA